MSTGCVWNPTCVSQGTPCKSTNCPNYPHPAGAAPEREPPPDVRVLAEKLVTAVVTAGSLYDARDTAIKFLQAERERDPTNGADVRAFAADLIRERKHIHVSFCTSRCDYARQLEDLAARVETEALPS